MKKVFSIPQLFLVTVMFSLLLLCACGDDANNPNQPINKVLGKFVNQNDTAIADITIEVADTNGNLISTDVTDENGQFDIKNIPANSENFTVVFANEDGIIYFKKLSEIIELSKKAADKVAIIVFDDKVNQNSKSLQLVVVEYIRENYQPLLDGVTVSLGMNSARTVVKQTEYGGRVLFENLYPGEYKLKVSYQGENSNDKYITYNNNSYLIDFSDGEKTLRDTIVLLRGDENCSSKAIIVVNDSTTKLPIKNVTVMGPFGREFKTDAEGKVVFENLCQGTEYHVYIRNATNEEAGISFDFVMDDTVRQFTRYLSGYENEVAEYCCNNEVTFYLKDTITNQIIKDVNIAKNVRISFYKESRIHPVQFDPSKESVAQFKEDGRFVVENLCNGRYEPSIFGTKLDILLTCDEKKEITILFDEKKDLDCQCWIRLDFRDSTLTGYDYYVEDVKVTMTNKATNDKIEMISNKLGKAEDVNLSRGIYIIKIEKDGYESQQFEVEVTCLESSFVETIFLKKL